MESQHPVLLWRVAAGITCVDDNIRNCMGTGEPCDPDSTTAAIAGAMVGKLVGLADARRRLIKVVHTVQANWKPRDRQETPPITCG